MVTCPICLDECLNSNSYKLSECGHTFHTECIISWFRSSTSSKFCPTCKTPPCTLNNVELPQKQKLQILRTYSKTNGQNTILLRLLFEQYDKFILKKVKLKNISDNENRIIKIERKIVTNKKRILAIPFERIIIPIQKTIFR